MVTRRVLWLLLVGVMITGAAWAAPTWLATGTVTKVDGNTVYFLSRDNAVFRVDISRAEIFTGIQAGGEVRAGDTVRVFGQLTKPNLVTAERVRIVAGGAAAGKGPKELHVIVEPEPAALTPSVPSQGQNCPSDATCGAPRNWEGKGIITDIDYRGHQVTLQTSMLSYTVDVHNAMMVRGTVRVFLGSLNIGDTIWVSGQLVAQNVVDGRQIRVLRNVAQAQGALPLLPISMVGTIQQVDYASRTFRMQGPTASIVVSCDDNTDILFRDIKKQFNDLKPGTRVSMSGNGSLASGYAANYIQIIGEPS